MLEYDVEYLVEEPVGVLPESFDLVASILKWKIGHGWVVGTSAGLEATYEHLDGELDLDVETEARIQLIEHGLERGERFLIAVRVQDLQLVVVCSKEQK